MPTNDQFREKRVQIANLLARGDKVKSIASQLNVTTRCVYKVKSSIAKGESIETKPRSGRPRSKRTENNIKAVSKLIKKETRTTMSSVARKTGMIWMASL